MTRTLRTALVAAIGVIAAMLTVTLPSPALAGTSSPTRATAAAAADLKADCEARAAEAASQRGWARSRFELCHRYEQTVNLYTTTGQYLGLIEYDFWALGFAYSNSRRVDYVVSIEDVGISSQLNASLGYITVTAAGCSTTNVTCSSPVERADNVPGWFAIPTMTTITMTSPNDVGAAPYATVDLLAQFSVLVEYRDGRTVPYNETKALNSVRFDSAKSALGNGAFHGTVFVDYVPTAEFSMRAGSNHAQEARHIRDALIRPSLTFPSFVGKSVPGNSLSRPLHRMMDSSRRDQNGAASVAICTAVWGPDYATGGQQCDEFPFRSTYEGSYTSTVGAGNTGGACGPAGPPAPNTSRWNGSVRVIAGADNTNGGTLLGTFYGANRVLDCDAFLVSVLT